MSINNIYDVLKNLDIQYDEITHIPVYTAEEAQIVKEKIKGVGCKNLFLTDNKGKYFIYMLEDNKKANIQDIRKQIGVSHLSFADIKELKSILNLDIGSVTPLGIINDANNLVELIIDKELKEKKLLMHPNVNSKTISIDFKDVIKFIEYEKHNYYII